MKKTQRQIAVIGTGLVGTAFIAAAQTMGLAAVYGLIDVNRKLAAANVKDFEDAAPLFSAGHQVKLMDYADLKDVDVIVITAGRTHKQGETRLDLTVDNAKIMAEIARNVKAGGFKGIAVINANPVDVMAYVFAKYSGFDPSRVISSGTLLESSRLKHEIATRLNVSSAAVQALVLGEHGDSSVAVFETASVNGIPYSQLAKAHKITKADEDEMQTTVRRKGFVIWEGKGSTSFGIGANTARLVKAILDDEQAVYPVGAYLNGEYGLKDVYLGVPALIGANGVERVYELELSAEKHAQLQQSAGVLQESIRLALAQMPAPAATAAAKAAKAGKTAKTVKTGKVVKPAKPGKAGNQKKAAAKR